MASIHGYKSLDDKNLIVYEPVSRSKKPKDVFSLTVQVDQSLLNPDKVRSGEKKADSNPYLSTYKLKNGFVTHAMTYTKDQFDLIKKAAGGFKPIRNVVKGPIVGYVYGINASLLITKIGFRIDTSKPMKKTKNPQFGTNVLIKQKAVTMAAKEYRAKQMEKTVSNAKQKDNKEGNLSL